MSLPFDRISCNIQRGSVRRQGVVLRDNEHHLSNLKGHGQLMHMRIRYHFLADLHVTRRARETESEKRIRNTQNKPCRVESPDRDYRP